MALIIYDILLHLLFIISTPYFIYRMISMGKYRVGIPERMGFIAKEKLDALSGGDVVWFHAVSVGETKAVLPLLKLFRERHPGLKIVFSTITPTGNQVAEASGAGLIDALIYFPFDFSWSTRKVARLINPKLFVAVEKEIWPNHVRSLKELPTPVPILVVNGTLSKRSFKGYRKFSFFFNEMFQSIDCFSARTSRDATMALGLGITPERVTTTGNLKFDMKPDFDPKRVEALGAELGIGAADKVLVVGSTHSGEEEIILKAFKGLKDEYAPIKMVLGPRHPERFTEVEGLIKKAELSYVKRSREKANASTDVILLDTMGELSLVYGLSTVSFVGGTLADIGGHNLLEPAFFGKPVMYGPCLKSYLYMAEMLEEAGGGLRTTEAALSEDLRRLLDHEELRDKMGEAAHRVIEANAGATEKTLDLIDGFLNTKD